MFSESRRTYTAHPVVINVLSYLLKTTERYVITGCLSLYPCNYDDSHGDDNVKCIQIVAVSLFTPVAMTTVTKTTTLKVFRFHSVHTCNQMTVK